MKRHTLYTFPALALLLAATACTQDDAGTLPDGTQPLTLTAAIEGSADTRATVDGTWETGETVALQVTDGDGTQWYDYTVDDRGNLSGEYYWTKPSPITVQGLYPNIMVENNDWTWSVEEDQSSDADYQSGDLLCSESKTVSFGQTPNLTFYHQTAKVVVNIKQEGLPESISATTENISLTIGEGGILALEGKFTLPASADGDGRWLGTWASGSTKGSIKPHLATTPATGNFATYEALVIPQDVATGTKLLTFTAEKDGTSYGPFYYTLKGDAKWQAGYVYTYDITIFHYGLDVQVSESIDWNATNPGSGGIALKDTYDQSTNTYYVYTAEGLDAWATRARTDLTVNCILMDDIDYNNKEWTAIGNTSIDSYSGTFDGGGHTIRNIKINDNAQNNGLFGYIAGGGTVKNLTVKNASMTTSSTKYGIIAAWNDGTIENCVVSSCDITGSSDYVGCISYQNFGRISCCRVDKANVSCGSFGGIVWLNNGRIEASSFQGHINADGGALVETNSIIGGTIIACWTNATHEEGKTVAGIVRYLDGGSVTACYYGGDIGTGILEDRTGIGDATKVDGSSDLWNWEFATGSMNNRLGPDFGWHWQTDNRYTPPTLVPNN